MPDGGSFSPEQGVPQKESRWAKLRTVAQSKVGNLLSRKQKIPTAPSIPPIGQKETTTPQTAEIKKGITQKSPEQLQAQIEHFGDKGVREFSTEQALILKNSTLLATITDFNNLPPNLPSEIVDLITNHKDSYINFLRQEERSETTFREENIRIYNEKFKPLIAQLQAKMASGDIKMLPEYLGSGARGHAFRIEVDGKSYAAKFSSEPTQANFELKPLIRAKGIPHVAQLVSYSFADHVVIMELLPGEDVTTFPPKNAPNYSDAHIIQLIETVKELDRNGIMIDPKASNFMYDPKEGFSILDFHLNDSRGRYGIAQQVMDLRNALCARKFEKIDYNAPNYQGKADAQDMIKYSISLPMMVRFLTLLQQHYPDIIIDWKQHHEELKRQPRTSVSELIPRDYIPQNPDFEPYLKRLNELGF